MFGVLNINKPQGLTSHDVVARVRRKLNFKKVGHAGTLDPMATGVLPVYVGNATRLLEFGHTDKAYQGRMVLGTSTETWDAEGDVCTNADASHITETIVAEVLPRFVGTIEQRIPKYSAKKVQGQKLYEIARAGGVIETLPTKTVTLTACTLTGFEPATADHSNAIVTVDVACSTGTFMRTLAVDIGDALDVPAHLGGLIRTRHGAFTLDTAVDLETFMDAEDGAAYLQSPLPYLAIPVLGADLEHPLMNGLLHGMNLLERNLMLEAPLVFEQIRRHNLKNRDICLLADKTTGLPIAVAEWRNNALKPSKVFANSN